MTRDPSWWTSIRNWGKVAGIRMREVTVEGIGYEYLALTVIEFNEDRKIQRMRSYYDKLGLEQRVAAKAPGLKG